MKNTFRNLLGSALVGVGVLLAHPASATLNVEIVDQQAPVGGTATVTVTIDYDDSTNPIIASNLVIAFDGTVFTVGNVQNALPSGVLRFAETPYVNDEGTASAELVVPFDDSFGEKDPLTGPYTGNLVTFEVTVDSGADAGGYPFSWDLAGDDFHRTWFDSSDKITIDDSSDGTFTVLKFYNAIPDAQGVGEDDGDTVVDVLANDVDDSGQSVSESATVDSIDTTETLGAVTLTGDEVSYNPNGVFESLAQGATTTDSFTYTGSYNHPTEGVKTDTGTVTITVTGVNDAPGFTSSPVETATEDTVYTYNISASDVDTGATLTIASPVIPMWLTLTDNDGVSATLTGTPLNGDVGANAVTLTVSDGIADPVEQSFTITVANTNDAPTVENAIADQGATEDQAFSFTVPANTFGDVDVGDSLALTSDESLDWLSFTDNGDGTGTFSGTPTNSTDAGTTAITVTATDGSNAQTSDTFDLTVTAVNDPPVITEVSISPVNTLTPADLTATVTASDEETTVLDYSYLWKSGETTLATHETNSGTDTLTVAEQAGQGENYPVTVTVTVSDADESTDDDTAAAYVGNEPPAIVEGVNTTPAAQQTVAEGQDLTLKIEFTDVNNDPQDDGIASVIWEQNTNSGGWLEIRDGSITVPAGQSATDQYTFSPDNNTQLHDGSNTFAIRVTGTDTVGRTTTREWDVVVTDVNETPEITGTPGTVATEDVEYTFTPTATDDDTEDDPSGLTDPFSMTVDGSAYPTPDRGAGLLDWLTFDPSNGSLSGTPGNEDVGDDYNNIVISFTDGAGEKVSLASFSITVDNVNDAPVAVADSDMTDEDASVNIDVLDNDTDIDIDGQVGGSETGNVDGDQLTVNSVTQPASGSVTNNTTYVSFDPGSDFQSLDDGEDQQVTFTYTVSDGNGGTSDAATVTVMVNGANDAPVLSGTPTTDETYIAAAAGPAVPAAFTVVASVTPVAVTDVDVEDFTPTYTWEVVHHVDNTVEQLTSGSLDDDRTFEYPADDGGGLIQLYDQLRFSYTVSDGTDDSNTVSTTVSIGNEPPDIIEGDNSTPAGGRSVAEGESLVFKIEFSDVGNEPGDDGVAGVVWEKKVNDGDWVQVRDGGITAAVGQSATDEYTFTTDNDTQLHDASNTFAIRVTGSDGEGTTVREWAVTVTDVNEMPEITGTPDTVATENVQYTFTPTVTDDDTEDDPSGLTNPFSMTVDGNVYPTQKRLPETSTLDWLTFDPSNGSLTGTPGNEDVGDDYNNIVISFTDGAGEKVSLASFSITVDNVNDAPVAVADNDTTDEDTSVDIGVLGNDTDLDIGGHHNGGTLDGDVLAVNEIVTQPTLGSVTSNGTDVTFDPGDDFQYLDDGEDEVVTFTYTATDGKGGTSEAATVTVTVDGVNDAPVADAVSTYVKANKADVMEKESITFTLSATDVDTNDQGNLSFEITTTPTAEEGTLVKIETREAGPEYRFTPADDFRGLVELSYRAFDGTAYSADVTIKITVGTPQWYPYIDIGSYDDGFDGTGFYKAVITDPVTDEVLLTMQVKDKDAFEPIDYLNNGSTGLLPGTYDLTVSVYNQTDRKFEALAGMPVDLVVEAYGNPLVVSVVDPPVVENGSHVLEFDVENSSAYELELETPSGKVVTYGQDFRPNADGVITPDQTVQEVLTLTEAGEYTWTAVAVNPLGTDEEMNTFTIAEVAPPTTAPGQVDDATMTPVGVAGTAKDVGTLGVFFDWEPSAGATSYLIHVEKGTKIVVNMQEVADGDTAYGPVQLTPGFYRWAVIAVNGVNPDQEVWSDWVNFEVKAPAGNTTPVIETVSVVGDPIAADAAQLQFNITWQVEGTAIDLWLVSGADGSVFKGRFLVDAPGLATTVTVAKAAFGAFDFSVGGADYYYQITGVAQDKTTGDPSDMATYSVQDEVIPAGDPEKPIVGAIAGSVIPVTSVNATKLALVPTYSIFYNSVTYAAGTPKLIITNTGAGTFDATIPATYAKNGMYLYLKFVGSNEAGVESPHSDWKMYQYTGGAWVEL